MIDADYIDEGPQSRGFSRIWLALGLGALILLVGMTSLVAFGLNDEANDSADASTAEQAALSIEDVSYIAPQDLFDVTVQVAGLDDDNEVVCAGSGTVVTPNGQVLTSAEVVTPSEDCKFSRIGIAVTVDAESPPVLAYEAELLVVDTTLDLAAVRIVRNISDGSALEAQFSAPTLGNSDSIAQEDEISIIGFSSEGDRSLQTINTSVSGFVEPVGVSDVKLIRTESETPPGFVGATATDANGQVIGVVGSNSSNLDESCLDLPSAGAQEPSANGCQQPGVEATIIRPINLALDLVEEAETALPTEVDSTGYNDLSELAFTNPRFSIGQTGNQPDEVVVTAQAGVTELCFFADWEGMPDGSTLDVIWYINGEPRLDYSLRDKVWDDEASGDNFWVCAPDSDGLVAGTYEVGFFIDNKVIFAEGFVLSEEAVEVHEVTWTNDVESDAAICSLAINPKGSGPVGLNELAEGQTIAPGESITLQIAEGTIVAAADDCDGERLAVQLNGLLVDESKDFTIGT